MRAFSQIQGDATKRRHGDEITKRTCLHGHLFLRSSISFASAYSLVFVATNNIPPLFFTRRQNYLPLSKRPIHMYAWVLCRDFDCLHLFPAQSPVAISKKLKSHCWCLSRVEFEPIYSNRIVVLIRFVKHHKQTDCFRNKIRSSGEPSPKVCLTIRFLNAQHENAAYSDDAPTSHRPIVIACWICLSRVSYFFRLLSRHRNSRAPTVNDHVVWATPATFKSSK